MMTAEYQGIKFTDADVVDVSDYDRDVVGFVKKRNYDYVPYLIHDHGFGLCVVFAQNEQDALDAAVDADKLDRFMLDANDKTTREDYGEVVDGIWDWKPPVTFLGNAGEPFDIESVGIVQLPNPPFSFVALFNAAGKDVVKS